MMEKILTKSDVDFSIRPGTRQGNVADATLTSRRLGRRLASSDMAPEEVLVADERHGQSPARAVEQRLTNLLRGSSLPSSLLQVKAMLKDR